MTTLAGDHYIVISSDGHAGAQVHEYRDYLESKYHDEFDAWDATFVNPFDDLRADVRLPQLGQRGAPARARGRRCRRRGAVPQHHPAVLPVGEPAGAPPGRRRVRAPVGRAQGAQPVAGRLLRRHAGPTRRAWRRCSSTTSTPRSPRSSGRPSRACAAASCCPGVPPDSGLPPLYSRAYDRLWAACQDHEMPINNHSGAAGPAPELDATGMAVFMVELGVVLAPRVLAHGDRRRVRPLPGHQADPHRAVERLGAGHPRDARPPVPALPRPEHRRSRTSAAR